MTSCTTFFWKFIFTPLWICGFGSGVVIRFMHGGDIVYTLFWIIGAISLLWVCGRLKKVTVSELDEKLCISNFLREIQVPFDNVEKVSGSMLISPELVFISFKSPTAFGRSVAFMPKIRMIGGFSEHPAVAELRQIIFRKRNR